MKINHSLKTIGVLGILILFTASGLNAQRQKITVNSDWRFVRKDVKHARKTNFDDSDWTHVNIPHSWNDKDVMDEADGYYRGPAWYRKTLHIPEKMHDKRVFLYFEGANQEADVYVNGQHVGNHKGGYTAFAYDITPYLNTSADEKTENLLAVRLTNKHDPDIPPLAADFTFFGGIYRDVHLVATAKTHFRMAKFASKGVYITTPEVSEEKANVHIRGFVRSETDAERDLRIVTTIKNPENEVFKKTKTEITAQGGGKTTRFEQQITNIVDHELWSPENPYVYKVFTDIVDTETGRRIDRVQNPLGFRWYRFSADKGFFLNGEHIKLMGANRHQDYKGMANDLPDFLHYEDVQLLKDMGANFLRIAHYPQDPAITQTCDRIGLLSSIETPLVDYITESEGFYNNSKHMLREMIYQNINHPSIILWNFSNELLLWDPKKPGGDHFPRDTERYLDNMTGLMQDMQDIAREIDPDRSTMIVAHQSFDIYKKAKLTTIPDVVGWNLYPGWYGSDITGFDRFLEKHHEELPNQPLVVTEYGAGADPRIRTPEPIRFDFSMDYQDSLHTYYYKRIMNRPYVAGGAIWNFVDFNSEGRIDAVPHINNKGILTRDRRPKDTYSFYKAKLAEQPYIAIAPRLYSLRAGIQDAPGKDFTTKEIKVFTNADAVTCSLNGKTIGTDEVSQGRAVFEVPFTDGENIITARAKVDGETITDFQEVEVEVLPQNLKESALDFTTIAVNTGAHFYFTENHNRNYLWLPDKAYEEGSWGYTGGKVYYRNRHTPGSNADIWGSENDPLFQTQRIAPESYRFDVPQGDYEVTLYFSELLTEGKFENYMKQLEEDERYPYEEFSRVFHVSVNGMEVVNALDLEEEYGKNRAVTKSFPVRVNDENGIRIDFSAEAGKPVINAIKVRKK